MWIDHVTEHGAKRMRERVGLPKRALARQAEKALAQGLTHERYSGSFRRYLDKCRWYADALTDVRVHGNILYLFRSGALVTCWPLPTKYQHVKPSAA